MTRLVLANVDNEHQVVDVSKYGAEEKAKTLLCNHRMLWLARPGDVVVLPTCPAPEILSYWSRLNGGGNPEAELLILTPKMTKTQGEFLRQDRLFDPEFVASCREKISRLRSDNRPTELLAYYPDNYAAEFANSVGVEVTNGFIQEGGATLLNQKTAFRKIAAGLGLSIPPGAVCDNAADMRRAMKRFINDGRDFIIKLDRESGGLGNLIVHGPRTSGKRYGSSSVFAYVSEDDGFRLCDQIIPGISEAVVIEEYLSTEVVLYSEYFVEAPGRFFHVNDGTMDMEPLWVGFEIPGSYPTHLRVQFLDYSARIVAAASQLGHRGYINVDGLVAGGRCYINEINGRCGGCTHIFEIARRLFGPQVLARKYIKTYNHGVFARPGLLVADLARRDLLMLPGREAGVIPLNADDEYKYFEYMIIANSSEEALHLSHLARNMGTQGRDVA